MTILMHNAIFFVNRRNEIERFFYDPRIMERINRCANLHPAIIGSDNLRENAGITKNTEVIFSCWGFPNITPEEIDEFFPNLKAIFYSAGSVQGFAHNFLKKGVIVTSSWAANAVPVAEQCVGTIILASKGLVRAARIAAQKGWVAAAEYSRNLPGLFDINISFLGLGMISRKTIELLKPYRVNCLVYSSHLTGEDAAEMGVTRLDSMEEAFSRSFIISNHIANLPKNYRIIKKSHFDLMNDYGVFINSGRGQQLAEEDLLAALREKPGRTAYLDVTDPEPPIEGSPLYSAENVFLTPHLMGSFSNEIMRMIEYAVEEFELYASGRPLRYQVTLDMLESMA